MNANPQRQDEETASRKFLDSAGLLRWAVSPLRSLQNFPEHRAAPPAVNPRLPFWVAMKPSTNTKLLFGWGCLDPDDSTL